jgi:hypothetical protein
MAQEMSADPTERYKTERLNELAFSFKKTGALLAAIELGIFTAISEGARTVPEIARATGMEEEAADRLLIVCKALQLVREADGHYRNVSDVERYLVRGQRTYFGDYLVYQAGIEYSGWHKLAPHLRPPTEAQDPPKMYAALVSSPDAARQFTTAGYNASLPLAHRLARKFDFSKHRLWLDWAGGSGCYSIAACEQNPSLRTIIMDHPYVIPVAKEFVSKHDLEDRIEVRPGDFLKSEYPRGCDLISFITPLQGYMPDEVLRVLKSSHEALEPGGTIMVIDYMLNDEKTGPLDPAFLNLQTVRDGRYGGRVNSGAEFRELFAAAGFREINVWWLMPHQLGVVTGTKPA